MDALSMLAYGHADVKRAFEGLSDADWSQPGVTSHWSPRDLLAHLASFERMLEEALREVDGEPGPTPTLDAMRGQGGVTFNEDQVAARRDRPPAEIMAEYETAHAGVMALATRIGADRLREPGTVRWYGPTYALDDLIVYTNYAHKREHCAQMRRWRMERAPAG
jgi:hypothetical protein